MRGSLLYLSGLGIICMLHSCQGAPKCSDQDLDDEKPETPHVEDLKSKKYRMANQCGSILTSPSGQLTSPNYPRRYPNLLNCHWQINAPEGTKIVLSFMAFDLERNYDFLYIRDGAGSTATLIHKLTGDEDIADIVSPGNQLNIHFTTDYSVTHSGFSISWEFEGPGMADICGRVRILTSPSGQLISPNYPGRYPNLLNCHCTINAPEGTKIVLSFMAFDLERNYDFLYISGGAGSTTTLLHKLTGDDEIADFVSPGNQLTFHFTTDASVALSGFFISWEFEGPGTPEDY